MELTVGDNATADAQNDDIVRAVEAKPHGANWHIHLQSNGDDYIQAFAGKDGRYRVDFVDRGLSFMSANPVDAETLKTILVYYLNGDTAWRTECRFIPEKSPGSGARAGKRISSEPPVWAIILVAGAFFGIPLFLGLAEHLSAYVPEGVGIAAVFFLPMVVMGLAMAANKVLQARRAAVWPQTAGRITRSEVAASRHQGSGKATELINLPAVEYEFSVGGNKFTGTRISIGEDKAGANTEATLAHYPVGAAVMVYYDPADPGNSLLERDIPKDLPAGCLALLAILAALIVGGYWLVVHFTSFIAPYMNDGPDRVAVFAAIAGLVLLMLFFGSRFAAKEGSDWTVVPGKVVKSGTESYRTRSDRGRSSTYAPVVEYSYLVNGHAYRSRQIELGEAMDGTRAEAEQVAARYPEDSAVEVHYDPANPGNAALEPPARIAWSLLILAVVCFAVALYAGKFYR
jgi:hypothetical protein